MNITTFALGRRDSTPGVEAVSLIRVDGDVSESILDPVRQHPAITQARLIHLGKA